MSGRETPVNIASLMTTFNIEIRTLPDKLKCAQCKSVLKSACQVPCGCRFCRTCIDHVVARGGQFCPGGSQECGRTPLSTIVQDFRADKHVLKLICKCPNAGCTHECPLADMEGHLRVCSGKSVDCPFRELGCQHGRLTAADMSSHMQQESGSHSEILIGLVADMKREMEMLKQELTLKDEHGRHLENEMKIILDENKSIKREKEVLSERVRLLAENLELERNERRQSDERASAGISGVTRVVASNRNVLGTDIKAVRDDILSIKEQLDAMRCQMESTQVPVGLVQLADWLIDEDVGKVEWASPKTSGKFSRGERPYTYELASYNLVSEDSLMIFLRIWAGPSEAQLQWPFMGAVTITVAHRDNAEKCMREKRQCRIERAQDNQYRCSEEFTFSHAALRGAGLDLRRGVRVSCDIVPSAGQ